MTKKKTRNKRDEHKSSNVNQFIMTPTTLNSLADKLPPSSTALQALASAQQALSRTQSIPYSSGTVDLTYPDYILSDIFNMAGDPLPDPTAVRVPGGTATIPSTTALLFQALGPNYATNGTVGFGLLIGIPKLLTASGTAWIATQDGTLTSLFGSLSIVYPVPTANVNVTPSTSNLMNLVYYLATYGTANIRTYAQKLVNAYQVNPTRFTIAQYLQILDSQAVTTNRMTTFNATVYIHTITGMVSLPVDTPLSISITGSLSSIPATKALTTFDMVEYVTGNYPIKQGERVSIKVSVPVNDTPGGALELLSLLAMPYLNMDFNVLFLPS